MDQAEGKSIEALTLKEKMQVFVKAAKMLIDSWGAAGPIVAVALGLLGAGLISGVSAAKENKKE
jgi:hypothetical protein